MKVPTLTLYFGEDFADPLWAKQYFTLEAPLDHGHGRAGEWVIGRSPVADLTVTAVDISRRHCAIAYSYASDRWLVTDLGSKCRTVLSGRLLSPGDPEPVEIGDRLWLGSNLIHLVRDPDDTIGGDKEEDEEVGPATVATAPPPPAPPAPLPPAPEPPTTQWDVAGAGMVWLVNPRTNLGAAVRLVVVALVALVVVLVWGK